MRGAGNDLSFPNTTSCACDFNAVSTWLGYIGNSTGLRDRRPASHAGYLTSSSLPLFSLPSSSSLLLFLTFLTTPTTQTSILFFVFIVFGIFVAFNHDTPGILSFLSIL